MLTHRRQGRSRLQAKCALLQLEQAFGTFAFGIPLVGFEADLAFTCEEEDEAELGRPEGSSGNMLLEDTVTS